ncbi:contractile injection system protein, VgrG/Pvc8 family [Rhizobium sp. S163]|uniref:phage late control D family protein n=1 Tax=Rhizobium sp. S163 TaxID=3055039 RepID=UPI0025A9EEDD|nr:contractile injection system protein, VgrG/Pvc8 family [Rhizobium sp. S163]MDM9647767.1 contractile injection system protein, VgrG/Pvc8 family [Rhizobium sp. S163]
MRKPFVQVIGQSGADLVPGWAGAFVSAEYTDNDGGEADEVSFTFAVKPPFPDSPAEGTKYRFLYGWADGDMRDAGLFTYQSDSLGGDAESGYMMTITARSSDYIDADKAADSEHFEDTTVGEILDKLAARAGKTAVVDASIASIKIPYRLRYNQSLTGFANELAEEFGGTLKYAGGKMLVPARSSGMTASGKTMPTILAPFVEGTGFEISTEGKTRYAEVGNSYFDPDEGIQKLAEAASIGTSSRYLSMHPARSKSEAEHSAKAQGAEHARNSVTGSVEAEGDIDAMAGARVKLSGYGRSRDAADLVAASIHHSFTFDEGGGWLMSIELGNRKTSKETTGTE